MPNQKLRLTILTLLSIVVVIIIAPTARAQTDGKLAVLEERALKQAAAIVAPSTVRIETVGGLERVEEILAGTGPTTGVVVSADGYIITSSFNFAAKPSSILVTLPDGRRFAARQVASDNLKMLTLIKINAENLTPAPAAPRDSIRVGQWAIALGRTYETPFPSMSVGIVSALNRIWGKAIQTDAKVSPVNYGGPLVDIEGRVLGVLVPLSPQGKSDAAGVEWYDAGIGFAIPMSDIYAVLDQLKAEKDLHSGLLGITFESKDLYSTPPVVDHVWYNSPAQKAGIKSGDTIVEVNNAATTRITQVRHALGNAYAGDKIALSVNRDGETIKVDFELAAKLEPYESAFLGILPERLSTIEPAEAAGVEVRYVYADSPAAAAGLQRGDRITEFNDAPQSTAIELRDALSRARPGDKAVLTYLRKGESQTAEVELQKISAVIPAELPRSPIPLPAEKNEDSEKTGRLAETLETHAHDLWAFVPDDYNPDYQYALLVWIHPSRNTMEADMLKRWKQICRERGVILLAPKAGTAETWTPNEIGFIKAAVESFVHRYSIDQERIVLHGFDSGAVLAQQLAFKERELFPAICLARAPLAVQPPENRPDFPLQWDFVYGADDPQSRKIEASIQALEKMRYPVSHRAVPGLGQEYPPEPAIEEVGRWIDALDRI
ncbi:Periplasmic serine endoprotease DegP precursor [Symmachiella macrocystis]|uniref:Periplasmic serine endoprotease DegP n=1 Tax=Symmachiella macrocystis TaxID=2527985 RepID=A0A5C6B983_9PLAN|nr:PDZ domain-containing protein [Symmachiella macrocystis]TWU07084.1 Periplasmic serine endoprotease DegP precursor [Symmachiella macrocystis]